MANSEHISRVKKVINEEILKVEKCMRKIRDKGQDANTIDRSDFFDYKDELHLLRKAEEVLLKIK